MQYLSTRGGAPTLGFEEVTLAGLASDGGLYLPAEWPQFSPFEIQQMSGLPYADLAARIMQPFIGDALTTRELQAVCQDAYAGFAHRAVTPLTQIDQQHFLLELFHGPTLAFKDIALQLLGRLFERFLEGGDRPLTIIGATSGDTGSAAIEAVADRRNMAIVMLHPEGRVSEVQRRQMTTCTAANVHNIAIAGTFDDAQRIVKRMFTDPAMAGPFRLGAVNSINWTRLMAQIVYYFAAALQLGAPGRKVAFSVPTGNFGDVFAGYAAAQMGLPIERLIVATNANDILHRALQDGEYRQAPVTKTSSPSMDIAVSSNFERLLFEAGGHDAEALCDQMTAFEKEGRIALTQAQRRSIGSLFASARMDEAATARSMAWAASECGEPIDPHTAIGLAAARATPIARGIPVVTLATAHPSKFPDAVAAATGIRPGLPQRLGDLMMQEERYICLPDEYDAVCDYLRDRVQG